MSLLDSIAAKFFLKIKDNFGRPYNTHHFQRPMQKTIFQTAADTSDDAPRQHLTHVSDMEPLCWTSWNVSMQTAERKSFSLSKL